MTSEEQKHFIASIQWEAESLEIAALPGTIHEENCIVLIRIPPETVWSLGNASRSDLKCACKIWYNVFRDHISLQDYLNKMFGDTRC